jgi:hypothetical protein
MESLSVNHISSTTDQPKQQHQNFPKSKSNIKKHIISNDTDPELLSWKRKYEGISCINIRI